VVFVPQYFRVVRAETIRLKREPFIDAARVAGVPARRIMTRHILANATRSIPLILTLNAGAAVATLAGLGFLGFGIQPTAAAEWGYDLNRAQSDIASGIWWTGLFPGLAIALTVLGLTLLGEGAGDVRDPRLRARRRPSAPGACRGAADGSPGALLDITVLDIAGLGVTLATDDGQVTAVRELSLQVAPGEIVAIVGESGSGKTVTARAALRLLPATAATTGTVRLAGHDVLSATPRQLRRLRGRDAAMIFQDPGLVLNPVYPVGWQIAEGLRARGRISRRAARDRAVALLDLVGIPEARQRVRDYPHQFSGGQQQRLVIAAALALNPPLLVADEPTTALDVTVQAGILDLLRRLRDTAGTSILLITHNMGVVADLADRVLVMRDGRLVEAGDTAALFARPQQDYTKRLLDAVPRLGQRGAGALPADDTADTAPDDTANDGGGHSTPPFGEFAVAAEHLVVDYPGRLGQPGFRAVDDVTFRIRPGEVAGLVGESGSGKTTIARAIAGLVPASGGRLRVLGQELRGPGGGWRTRARRDIGFVFQDPAASFDPKLTIGMSIGEPIRVHDRADSRDVRRRVDALLEEVLLTPEHARRYPHELSGGQRQRAALARALALRPRLLIADEPTSALDVSVQASILELIRALQREHAFAVLLISHDLAVVDGLTDTVGVLYQGKLVEYGDRYQVLSRPAHDYTRRLIAASPVPDPAEQASRRAARRGAAEVTSG
jgi:peptide/nickel transport system ATP-binding protein